MPHTCNYFCQGPVHAINLLIPAALVPNNALPIDEQTSLLEQLLFELQVLERKYAEFPQAIERLIPVRELSVLEFYQQNFGWTFTDLPPTTLEKYLPYVALVRYGTKEVADAVSGF